MFNEFNNPNLLERIEDRKRGLRHLSENLIEAVVGLSTIEGRNEALLMHAQTHKMYSQLEKVESRVTEYTALVDEILTEFLHTQLMFRGRLCLHRMLGTGDERTGA